MNLTYKWNGFADEDEDGVDPGDELSFVLSAGYQFSLSSNVSLPAPLWRLRGIRGPIVVRAETH